MQSRTQILTLGGGAAPDKNELVVAVGGGDLVELVGVGVYPALLRAGGDGVVDEHARRVGQTLGQTRFHVSARRAPRTARRANVAETEPCLHTPCTSNSDTFTANPFLFTVIKLGQSHLVLLLFRPIIKIAHEVQI